MKRVNRNAPVLLAMFVLLALTAACQPVMREEPTVGLPNPASVYCEEQGGTLEIRTDNNGGQVGYCVFDDGSECEEWSFFRSQCRSGEFPPSQQLANPASVYCEEQGGTLEIRTAEAGGQAGYCVFDDGSECDEWAFFRGECTPGGE